MLYLVLNVALIVCKSHIVSLLFYEKEASYSTLLCWYSETYAASPLHVHTCEHGYEVYTCKLRQTGPSGTSPYFNPPTLLRSSQRGVGTMAGPPENVNRRRAGKQRLTPSVTTYKHPHRPAL